MAPTAARRANPVQRSYSQGLRGNPDACRPRRGSACNKSANRAGGDARFVFALSVQPTAAMDSGSGVEGAGGAFDKNPREATSKNAGPGGFPTAFDSKSGAPAAQARPRGAPRQVNGAPRSSRPTGWWIRGQAGDHRSPLHRRPKLRIARFRVSAKAHSLRWASAGPHRTSHGMKPIPKCIIGK